MPDLSSQLFVDDEEIIGKTIASYEMSTERYEVIIVFTDGTWTRLVDDTGYYRDCYGMMFEEG